MSSEQPWVTPALRYAVEVGWLPKNDVVKVFRNAGTSHLRSSCELSAPVELTWAQLVEEGDICSLCLPHALNALIPVSLQYLIPSYTALGFNLPHVVSTSVPGVKTLDFWLLFHHVIAPVIKQYLSGVSKEFLELTKRVETGLEQTDLGVFEDAKKVAWSHFVDMRVSPKPVGESNWMLLPIEFSPDAPVVLGPGQKRGWLRDVLLYADQMQVVDVVDSLRPVTHGISKSLLVSLPSEFTSKGSSALVLCSASKYDLTQVTQTLLLPNVTPRSFEQTCAALVLATC